MEKEQFMCYITYAVPADMLPNVTFSGAPFIQKTHMPPPEALPVYPEGFVPEWFCAGSFPEDDWEE